MSREIDKLSEYLKEHEGLAEGTSPEPPVPQEIIRVLKIVEYVGERREVENTLKRGIQPNGLNAGRIVINTAILGTFPEVLDGSAAEAIRQVLKAQQVYEKFVEDEQIADDNGYLAQKIQASYARQGQAIAPPPLQSGPPFPSPGGLGPVNWPKILSNAKPSTKKI